MANIPNAGNYRKANHNPSFQNGGSSRPQQQRWQPAQPRTFVQAEVSDSNTGWWLLLGLIVIGVLTFVLFKFPWLLTVGLVVGAGAAVIWGIHALTKNVGDTIGWTFGIAVVAGAALLLINFPILWVGVALLVIAILSN